MGAGPAVAPEAAPAAGQTLDLATRCYQDIRRRIVRRELLPGERLVPEVLARALAVSRTPVQDALRRLALEGLVEIVPRRGTVVTRITAKGVAEVADIRLMIEAHAAVAAAARATAADVAALRRHLERLDAVLAMDGERAAFEAWSPANAEFHRYLVQLAGNDRLLRLYDGLNTPAAELRVLGGRGLTPFQEFQAQHRAMVDALAAGDVPALQELIPRHITQATQRLLSTLHLLGGAL